MGANKIPRTDRVPSDVEFSTKYYEDGDFSYSFNPEVELSERAFKQINGRPIEITNVTNVTNTDGYFVVTDQPGRVKVVNANVSKFVQLIQSNLQFVQYDPISNFPSTLNNNAYNSIIEINSNQWDGMHWFNGYLTFDGATSGSVDVMLTLDMDQIITRSIVDMTETESTKTIYINGFTYIPEGSNIQLRLRQNTNVVDLLPEGRLTHYALETPTPKPAVPL